MPPATAFRLQVAALCHDREPLALEVSRLWPATPLAMLLSGHVDKFEQFVDLAIVDGLVTEKFRVDFARALFAAATPAEPRVREISEMVRVLFSRVRGSVSTPDDRVLRWQRLDRIDDLDPKWKLNLARQLFEPSSALANFGDAVRLCISSLAGIAPPRMISALAALL